MQVQPFVTHFRCNRQSKLENCEELFEFIKDNKFDYVIDFSAYDRYAVEQAVKALKSKVGVYIYISSDSVYDACDKRYGDPVKETEAVRPEDPVIQSNMEHAFNYGHRKLEGEECLVEQRKDGGFPYVILRPPDVIGPRDSTWRWPTYQLWTVASTIVTDRKLTVPFYLDKHNMSLVYVDDLAQAIVNIIDLFPHVQDEALNLAWKETFFLADIISDIANFTDSNKVTVYMDSGQNNVAYYYPSVRCGPINVTKAEELIGWKPTPVVQAFNETVQFYQEVMKGDKFITQRNELVQVVANQLYRNEKLRFYEALEKFYEIDLKQFKHNHDEL